MYIRAAKIIDLEREYGAVYWNYETEEIGLIEVKGSTGHNRDVYLIDTDTNEETFKMTLQFGIAKYSLDDEDPVRSACYFSGQLGVLVDTTQVKSGYKRAISRICWFRPTGLATMPPDFNELYSPFASFALRNETVAGRTFFFQEAASGGIMRWGASDPTAARIYQIFPWRTVYGNVRGMDFWENGETTSPEEHLVIAGENGLVVWMDVSDWLGPGAATTLVMNKYKAFGCLEAKDITDITIDRVNNILWVLDQGKRLLQYNMEPFGDESEDYENTPQAIKVWTEDAEIAVGDETDCFGQFYDMWGQLIEREDLPVDFIAGGGLGKFYDEEADEYKISVRTFTDEDGIATAIYKANGGLLDD
jgi:hypothetical protein